MNLTPPTEHQLLVFWVALLGLVVAARVLGALAVRVGQPAVVGELGAGLLLGPSVLGKVAPDITDWLFPDDDVQTAMLFTVGWLGVVFLLIATGYETDLGLIRRLGAAAAAVSAGSLVVPLAAGFGVGYLLPSTFIGDGTDTLVFALFIAAALSISSLPVIAKILTEMGFMRRNFGQLTLAAGMANDVFGWILLGVVAGLAQAGGLKFDKLAITLGGLALFFAVAFTLGQRLIDIALRQVRRAEAGPVPGVAVILIAAIALGSVTQALHVEAVLGAFVAGVLIARSRYRDDAAMHNLEHVTTAFFAPVFFATAGLRVDLGLLADPTTLAWAAAVIAVASISKFVGSVAGAYVARLPGREGAALGVGLNARGALEIVIATVGLTLGVLNQASYTIVVVMAMATSMMAPPLLRAVLRDYDGTPAEQERLQRERTMATNLVVRGDQLLIPAGGDPASIMAAQVLDLAWPPDVDVTVLAPEADKSGIEGPARARGIKAVHNVLADRDITTETTNKPLPEAALEEARLGYGAIGIGVDHPDDDQPLLDDETERIVTNSPVPVVLVRAGRHLGRDLPWAYSRAIVPVAGTNASRAAKEIAFNISARLGTQLSLVHVTRQPEPATVGGNGNQPDAAAAAMRVLDDAVALADTMGARAEPVLRHDASPAEGIVSLSDDLDADLIVVGCTRRTAGDEAFLGHTVESILRHANATVIAVVSPSTDREAN